VARAATGSTAHMARYSAPLRRSRWSARTGSPEVLEFFGREGMSVDESAAFEEFLFNMTSEELATLRRERQKQHPSAASATWASEVLGRRIEELEHSHEIDPMALYRSYQHRQLAADFRMKAKAAGPHRTAECYLMAYILESSCKAVSLGCCSLGAAPAQELLRQRLRVLDRAIVADVANDCARCFRIPWRPRRMRSSQLERPLARTRFGACWA